MMPEHFSLIKLVLRSIVYYRRRILLTILSVAVAAMVITGALITGNSVKHSLKLIATQTIGNAKALITTENRWFTIDAVDRLKAAVDKPLAPLIHIRTNLSSNQGSIKINLYGINEDFFAVAGTAPTPTPSLMPGMIALNRAAATQLGVKPGDRLTLRYFSPGTMPVDAPFSQSNSSIKTLSLELSAIIKPENGGNFDFSTSQKTAFNGFIDISHLSQIIEQPGRANMIISAGENDLIEKLGEHFTLEDYELFLNQTDDYIDLRSRRVFMGHDVIRAAKKAEFEHHLVFGYFVNSINKDEKTVPYSFIAGAQKMHPTNDDEIIFNEWLAERLNAQIGDEISISAYLPAPFGALSEASASFRLSAIIDMQSAVQHVMLAPEFPGMENAETCHDWDPGLPINLERISDADEDYWYEYGNLPKAFISFTKAQNMWQNRFGAATMIRFNHHSIEEIESHLPALILPENNGFNQIYIAAEKEFATDNSIDFSGLFFGLGLFIIIAALLLSGMLLNLYFESRHQDFAVLQSCGFNNKNLFAILSTETMFYAISGSLLGTLAGVAYAALMLRLLRSVWQGAVNTPNISLHLDATSLIIGFAASVAACQLAMLSSAHKYFSSSRLQLLSGQKQSKQPRVALAIVATILAAFIILSAPSTDSMLRAILFFAAGILLLFSFTQLSLRVLFSLGKTSGRLTLTSLAIKNCSRRLDRSAAVIRIMAVALFLLTAVSANQRGMLADWQQKSSGTGGYSHYVETALPLSGDLNSHEGRLSHKIEDLPPEVLITQLPLADGTDASCTNLNQVSRPPFVGVNIDQFHNRFSFAGIATGTTDWQLLTQSFDEPDIIAGITDLDTILWNFKMLPGDHLEMITGSGKTVRIKLVAGLNNSILQGKILVSLDNFYRLWPETHGSHIFLVEAPKEHFSSTTQIITEALSRYGVHIESANERLAAFNQVQNTYLSIFMVLSGLGLILGCGGLAVLAKRNIIERSAELGHMRLLGFSPRSLQKMLFVEHATLYVLGMASGLGAAAIAIIPVITSALGNMPTASTFILITFITAAAMLLIKLSISLPDNLAQQAHAETE